MVHLVIKNLPAVLTELVTALRICKVVCNYCHHIQTGSEAHPDSYPMCPGAKAADA